MQLGHAIAGRGRCLVILDNFEQVVEHAAGHARPLARPGRRSDLRRHQPRAPAPAGRGGASRRAAAAEQRTPSSCSSPARARSGRTSRSATRTAPRWPRSCGCSTVLPLAIELAAARVRVLSPAQLVERMRDRFRLLAGARGAAARQATLRAAIDWSWDLLAPWEQAALAQCSVFEGGFTLEAAEAVLDLSRLARGAAGDGRGAGAGRQESAAHLGPRRAGPLRHRGAVLRDVHQHPRVRGGEAQCQRARGATRSRGAPRPLLRAASGPTRRSKRCSGTAASGGAARSRSSSTTSSPPAAGPWAAATASRRSPPTARPGKCWSSRGRSRWALPWERRCSRSTASTPRCAPRLALTRALALMARRAHRGGRDVARAGARTRSRDARPAPGRDHPRAAWATCSASRAGWKRHAGHLDAALAIHREAGNRRAEGSVLGNLGLLHHEQGRIEQARAHYEAALAIHREMGDRRFEGIVLGNLGNLHGDQGQVERGAGDTTRPRSPSPARWVTAAWRASSSATWVACTMSRAGPRRPALLPARPRDPP